MRAGRATSAAPPDGERFVALLRAVNVGGHSVDTHTLRDAFIRAGAADARTVAPAVVKRYIVFPGEFVEGAAGVSGTARNWSTVLKLAAALGT